MPRTAPTRCVTRDGDLKARVPTQSNRNDTRGTLAPRAQGDGSGSPHKRLASLFLIQAIIGGPPRVDRPAAGSNP